MNRFVKITVLTLAALATVATTIQFADAGERQWRKHGKPWNKRTVVVGVTAGVIAGAVVATRPRVIYREAPVVIDEGPIYDPETVYDDETVYVDPGRDDDRRVYSDDAPEVDDYAAPDEDYRYDLQPQDYGDRAATSDDYFPEKPRPRAVQRDTTDTLGRQTASGKQPKRTTSNDQVDATNLKPWTRQWRDYCASRFSSFNPQNGTYLGYDQKRHFCKAG